MRLRTTVAIALATGTAAAGAGTAVTGPAAAQPVGPGAVRDVAAAKADTLVASRPSVLMAGRYDAFQRQKTLTSHGLHYVPYLRTYKGLLVRGGDFVVVTDSTGATRYTSVAQSTPIGALSTTPELTATAAAAVAKKQLEKVTTVEGTTLVVVAVEGKPARLAWETTVQGSGAEGYRRLTVAVDALTGKVLRTQENAVEVTGTGDGWIYGPVSVNSTQTGSTYSLTDPDRPTLSCQDDATKKTFSKPANTWGNGNGTDKETGCVDAFYVAQQQAAMLSQWLGRNGQDGNGGAWPIRVGLAMQNAYFDGLAIRVGRNAAGRWVSSADVVGHELGHGIDTSTPGGLSQGRTAEFVADAFGAATEWFADNPNDPPDYLVGEQVDLFGDGPIRNMYNPSALGHPNCYSDSIPSRLGSHEVAGPGNHWFYLLAQGTSGNGQPASTTCDSSTITGLGIQKAITILYNAMLMKTSSSSYLKYRTWTLTAAKNLYPNSCTEFNTVKAAWDAVSVPAQPADPTCVAATAPVGGKPAAKAAEPALRTVSLAGTVALSNCSGSLVRFPNSADTDPALVLSNGHCSSLFAPGVVVTNRAVNRAVNLLDASGAQVAALKSTKLTYATMTDTDVAIYELTTTYAAIKNAYGVSALTLRDTHPTAGTAITVASGAWKKLFDCDLDGFVYRLKEDTWTWKDSIRYTSACQTGSGTSGSPVIDQATGDVVAIHNTGNENGGTCTRDNPCEVDERGKVTVHRGINYAQQTYQIPACFTTGNQLDLNATGCTLPKP